MSNDRGRSRSPVRSGGEDKILHKDDWECPECKANNFSRRVDCYKCHVRKPPKDPKHPYDWECSKCKGNNYSRRVDCYQCKTPKPQFISSSGEQWTCQECRSSNYPHRIKCFRCQAPKIQGGRMSRMRRYSQERTFRPRSPIRSLRNGLPERAPDFDPVTGQAEWICSTCRVNNFYKRFDCYNCQAQKPTNTMMNGRDIPKKRNPLDWICPKCQGLNFSKRVDCYKCNLPKPESENNNNMTREGPMRPGDWTCSGCKGHNFSRREDCYKCKEPKPKTLGLVH